MSFSLRFRSPSLTLTRGFSGYTRETVTSGENVRMDFHDAGYGGRVVLYIVSLFRKSSSLVADEFASQWMGILDAIWQNYAYWIMVSPQLSSRQCDTAHIIPFTGFHEQPKLAARLPRSSLRTPRSSALPLTFSGRSVSTRPFSRLELLACSGWTRTSCPT